MVHSQNEKASHLASRNDHTDTYDTSTNTFPRNLTAFRFLPLVGGRNQELPVTAMVSQVSCLDHAIGAFT